MADFDSSLPVRTQNNGDVVARIADGTTPTQLLGVDASGRLTVKLQDGAGNSITSQVSGAQRALDVGINVAGVQIDPRQIRPLTAADIVTARLQDGAGTSVTLGQKLMAASLPVVIASDQSTLIVRDQADGPVTPGAAASFSQLMGGQFNTALPTLTNAQQAAIQVDANGRLIIRPLVAADVVTSRLQDGAGNAITSAAAGSTRPLDVALRDGAGALYSASNPIPVTISADQPGIEINNYNTVASVAGGASSNHDYTAAGPLLLGQVHVSASGKLKAELQVETAAASNIFNTVAVFFNSTANPNMDLTLRSPISVVTGARVRIIRTNKDNQSQDVYSTISAQQV